MKWTQLATGLVVVISATACLAETPQLAGDRPTAMSLLQQGRLFGGQSGQNWWSRYGEPVNAAALAQAESSPSDKGAYAASPIYGDGYAFAPGACDCPPPCIWQLWTGYYQDPMRCHPGNHLLHRRCAGCGAYAGGGGPCGCGKACDISCTTKAACGCATPVTCTTPAADCGCKPVCGKCRHFHFGKWHGFAAHWTKSCDSCSAPLSCGCTTPVAPMIGSEMQATGKISSPLSQEAVLYPLPRLN